MLVTLLALLTLFRILRRSFADPAVRGLIVSLAVVLATGTIAYSLIEGWRLLDAFYFSVVALMTVGFGDFTPETDAGKLFTVVYLFLGVGIFAATATTIVQRSRMWVRVEKEPEPGDRNPAGND